MKGTVALLVALGFAGAASGAEKAPAKADAAAGQAIVTKVCAACHGADGNSPTGPDFPRLAGQREDYLLKALRDYKSGARKNAIMAGQAQALTAKDVENLAAYYARQKPRAAPAK